MNYSSFFFWFPSRTRQCIYVQHLCSAFGQPAQQPLIQNCILSSSSRCTSMPFLFVAASFGHTRLTHKDDLCPFFCPCMHSSHFRRELFFETIPTFKNGTHRLGASTPQYILLPRSERNAILGLRWKMTKIPLVFYEEEYSN